MGRAESSCALGSNLTTAQPAWFRAPATGDLHFASRIPGVVDQGRTIDTLTADLDGEPRPQGAGFDIGADEFTEQPATPLWLNRYSCGVPMGHAEDFNIQHSTSNIQ
ncbi:MAG: hypothetical protein NTW21_28380 [Verrucomicrobia bacterium]|nr:hypothetical protein [Verrucomicrobiota bacterium]